MLNPIPLYYIILHQKQHMQHKQYTLWHYLLTLYFGIGFPLMVLLIIPIVLLNDALYGQYKGWNRNFKVFKKVFQVGYFMLGIRHKVIYEYNHDTAQKYVFVLNHSSFFDIPEVLLGINQPIRVLGKSGPNKIPVFGYYYRKSTVMVDRTSDESRLKSIRLLKHYLQQGISIVVFPEGTFNNTTSPLKAMYSGAFKIAIETQTNIKPIILLDTYNRLHQSGIGLENGPSRMVYLQEVSVQGLQPKDAHTLQQQVEHIMANALIRYKASWVHTQPSLIL